MNSIADIRANLETLAASPRRPVGLVFHVSVRHPLLTVVGNEIQFGCPPPDGIVYSGIPIYFDANQVETCVIFYDEIALSAYLKRGLEPQAWFMVRLKLIQDALR